ncbi:MAG TPA: glycoside hydrolase family 3 C-terminal domain-containing protein [Acidimicrobiales bacterium]|nr:glycoside hydrolase family 3 C-terminal domain-containing protein [Acidimicrobiales bacterium]
MVAGLTLDEKVSLTAGQDLWTVPGVARVGIPSVGVTDGPNGARGTTLPGPEAEPTTCVPCGSALGASWDADLVRDVGVLLGEEALARGCRVLLAPTVNIPRSPLAGRNFECYSEDPFLSGTLAAAFIEGVQSQDVATTVKHFVGNDAEFERYTMSSVIDERTLREIYLVPFELAVRDGGTLGVMTGYNRLNGTWCSEDRGLLTGILRREWGFGGFVLTDWYAVASTVGSTDAGVDLEMPGPGRAYGPALADAVRGGSVTEAALDDQVVRLLSVYDRLGLLDGGDAGETPPRPEAERRAGVARRAATGSIVLLKNSGVLPLPESLGRVAVVGPNADRAVMMGGGSAGVEPDHRTSPLDALRMKLGDGVTVVHEPGVDLTRTTSTLRIPLVARYFGGLGGGGEVVHEAELHATELTHLGPPAPGMDGPFSIRATGRYRPSETGRYLFTLTHVGQARVLVDGAVILDGFGESLPRGQSFMGLGCEELTHEVDLDAGRDVEIGIEYDTLGAHGLFAFRVGCRWKAPADLVGRAVAAARDADVAVVVVGTSHEWESEGFDRESLALPAEQDDLVREVAAANPKTVVVVNTGAPVAMPWADTVGAVVQIWFGGQEMGPAVADVLVGDAEPGGRLPASVPVRIEDTPAYPTFPGERSELRYGEGLLVGYRWYEGRKIDVTFPFGHGLSYTTFTLGEPVLSAGSFAAGDDLVVTVPVTNSGARAGTEIVQCYVAPPAGELFRPAKELKAFGKIGLEPGETGTVTLVLSDRSFACWDPGTSETTQLRARMPLGSMINKAAGPDRPPGWRIDPGPYVLRIGRSSADIAWSVPVTVVA